MASQDATKHPSWEVPAFQAFELKSKASDYCIVVVVLNEGERLIRQLERMRDFQRHVDIVVVDGSSEDGSTELTRLAALGIRALLVTEERGLGTATRVGYAFALNEGYAGVITIDGNGKDGVEAIPDFIKRFEDGFDLIQGSRFLGHHENTPLDRYLAIRLFMAPVLFLGCGFYYRDPTNAFRGCSRKFLLDRRVQPIRSVFKNFNLHNYLNYRAAKLKFKVTEIPVARVYPESKSYPTKIRSPRTKLLCLWEMLATSLGRYDPE
jgi:dolichol-phosphate mannosyltransferase